MKPPSGLFEKSKQTAERKQTADHLNRYNRKREAERARRGLPPADDHITRHFREREEKKEEYRGVIHK